MEFKTLFYGLKKKIKNAREKGFIFNQINKLTKNSFSILSNVCIQYYLKFRIPILRRQLFKNFHKNVNI